MLKKCVLDGDSGIKPELKDSSTQTNGYIAPPPSAAAAANGLTASPNNNAAPNEEHPARVNNNYNNGPILPIKGDL